MKTLYLECSMGAAGDMLMAALMELLPEGTHFTEELNALGLPGVRAERETVVKCGITGTHMRIFVHDEEEGADCAHHHHEHTGDHEQESVHTHCHDHDHANQHDNAHTHDQCHDHQHDHGHAHHHSHAGMLEIQEIIEGLAVSQKVKQDALAIYHLIAEAEAKAHGRPVTEVHFHEVGALDAVADIVGVCLLMEKLAPDRVLASPVCTGYGTVRCAHGVLPVPAPATAYLLQGIPSYGGTVQGELCTPTGAAILKYFVSEYGPQPALRVERIGYGMGTRDFSDHANCLRAFLGTAKEQAESVAELHCTVDDMTGEELAFAMEELMTAGALDVFLVPVYMKKGRPGHDLTCLARLGNADALAELMLRHTTSWGVRRMDCMRYLMTRENRSIKTTLGEISVKCGEGYGTEKHKIEYEDAARIARERGLPLRVVMEHTER